MIIQILMVISQGRRRFGYDRIIHNIYIRASATHNILENISQSIRYFYAGLEIRLSGTYNTDVSNVYFTVSWARIYTFTPSARMYTSTSWARIYTSTDNVSFVTTYNYVNFYGSVNKCDISNLKKNLW